MLLPVASCNPLVLSPNALHNLSPHSLSSHNDYEGVDPALGCQAASSVPGFLHIHISFLYSAMFLLLFGTSSAHPQSYLTILPPFLFSYLLFTGRLSKNVVTFWSFTGCYLQLSDQPISAYFFFVLVLLMPALKIYGITSVFTSACHIKLLIKK